MEQQSILATGSVRRGLRRLAVVRLRSPVRAGLMSKLAEERDDQLGPDFDFCAGHVGPMRLM